MWGVWGVWEVWGEGGVWGVWEECGEREEVVLENLVSLKIFLIIFILLPALLTIRIDRHQPCLDAKGRAASHI
ncbi:hypothetical protein BJP36_15200 [Moorena producens JHB]|uniref:Uncharacterized protein n=1 Tax=Moorena producens (strain JHB) TaxID=1454205 RepID=A0A1D9G099_MOOP1|nr:hypothetical protein [Moorena producens]AOY81049.1 hypothetical protein BJP36_15200 [Moorena producens JHB]